MLVEEAAGLSSKAGLETSLPSPRVDPGDSGNTNRLALSSDSPLRAPHTFPQMFPHYFHHIEGKDRRGVGINILT